MFCCCTCTGVRVCYNVALNLGVTIVCPSSDNTSHVAAADPTALALGVVVYAGVGRERPLARAKGQRRDASENAFGLAQR